MPDTPSGLPRPRPSTRRPGLAARQSVSRRVRRPYFHAVVIAIAVSAAFYATFLPSRATSRASGLANPADGLSFSGAIVSKPAQEVLALSAANPAPRTVAASSEPAPEDESQATFASRTLLQGPAGAALLAAADAKPPCDTSQSPLYCVYTIEAGDTLSGIAAKFGLKSTEDVASWELLVASNKPDIASENDLLQIGQKLRIPTAPDAIAEAAEAAAAADEDEPAEPTRNAVIHTVLSAETLSDIADQYGVSVKAIAAANNLRDPDSLQIGQELLIPNPTQLAAPPAPASSGGGSGRPSVGPRSASGLIWPTTGPISSYYGPGHPLGIDIDLYANPNAPVGAAMAGVVTFAGGNACCSYGLYVVIDHGNGYQTLYAHLSKVSVSVGERVSQGELIGYGGRSGYATGPHLHFEVHVSGAVVDPLAYLP